MTQPSQHDIEVELIKITQQLLLEAGQPHQRTIRLTDSLQHQLGIDSLGRAELFTRIEKAFHVTMPDRLMSHAETLNDIAAFLLTADPTVPLPSQQKIITSHGEHSSADPHGAHSLLEVLFLYAQHSPNKPHLYFQHEDGGEEIITYAQLLNSSLMLAAGLRSRGLREGETVAIMLPSEPAFFYSFLGVLLAGGVPVPIYPPFRLYMLEAYAKMESHILRNAEVRCLITFDKAEKLGLLLQSFVPSLKHVVTPTELMQSKSILGNPFVARYEHPAFIQYTSGSTSEPKGVLLSHYNLLANIRAYGKAIEVKPDDVAVSWLPLYHDLGLIGMWLGSFYHGVPLILMTPFTFLNHPARWLWAIHHHRGTVSGAPNFAYELCIRKIEPHMIEGLDLSSWRLAANGAEKVYPRTMEAFAKKFAPYGFNPNALMPVYGLAEATVGLAVPRPGRGYKTDIIDRKQFEEARVASSTNHANSLSFVSSGPPLEGHEIRVIDEENHVLAERQVGQLQFKGPSSMQGYYNNPRATAAIYHDGWLDTGDLAYIADGELYITGRKKDLIIKAGRNLYPAEMEELVGNLPGIRQGCVAVFGVPQGERGTEQLIVVAETRETEKNSREQLIAAINEAASTALDVVPEEVVLVAPHVVPKTSSGKLQRAACKQLYLQGKLHAQQSPAWLQVIKLSLKAVARKCYAAMKTTSKFIYTVYLGLLVVLTFFPLYLYAMRVSREKAAIAAKRWSKMIITLAGCRIHLIGAENLSRVSPVIYAANHASYADAIFMIAIVPTDTRFVVKKELLSTPCLRGFVRKLDYLAVDRFDLPQGIEDAKQLTKTLQAGHSVFIFPEGTFGYSAGLRPFRLGAFKMAAETGVPICPIGLNGTRKILRDDEKLLRPGSVQITVSELIDPARDEWQDITRMRNQVRAEIAKHCGEPTLDYIAAQAVAPNQSEHS